MKNLLIRVLSMVIMYLIFLGLIWLPKKFDEAVERKPVCQYVKGIWGTDKEGTPAVKKEYLLCSEFVPEVKSSGEYETIWIYEK